MTAFHGSWGIKSILYDTFWNETNDRLKTASPVECFTVWASRGAVCVVACVSEDMRSECCILQRSVFQKHSCWLKHLLQLQYIHSWPSKTDRIMGSARREVDSFGQHLLHWLVGSTQNNKTQLKSCFTLEAARQTRSCLRGSVNGRQGL